MLFYYVQLQFQVSRAVVLGRTSAPSTMVGRRRKQPQSDQSPRRHQQRHPVPTQRLMLQDTVTVLGIRLHSIRLPKNKNCQCIPSSPHSPAQIHPIKPSGPARPSSPAHNSTTVSVCLQQWNTSSPSPSAFHRLPSTSRARCLPRPRLLLWTLVIRE
jgi:hypothetical protein